MLLHTKLLICICITLACKSSAALAIIGDLYENECTDFENSFLHVRAQSKYLCTIYMVGFYRKA